VDILSLIPTHLSSQRDRFRASFVCRHWRRTFLQNAILWSQLYLSKGEVYVKTLLERAKGSALDITANDTDPVCTIALLPPHAKRIRSLDFVCSDWVAIIQKFSEVSSGPLPLLTTLRIATIDEFGMEDHDDVTLPSSPLFGNGVNLKEFFLRSEESPSLGNFRFPNLTTFELSARPEQDFHASQLLNFLEASPMLQTVDMKIIANVVLEGVPRERIVVLPNVETFSLVVDDSGPGYKIAAHVSCPSAGRTSFMCEPRASEVSLWEIFPSSVSWNAIVRQYTRSPAEEVTLGMQITSGPTIICSLTFRSSGATVIRLGFKLTKSGGYGGGLAEDAYYKVFSQASRIIRDQPADVRRLHFNHSSGVFGPTQRKRIANEVGRVFKSVGPLEELTMDGCDVRSYLIPFFNLPEIEQPTAFPPVEELTVLCPSPASPAECMAAIVGLAKSQHALGVPFKCVTVNMMGLPKTMAKELRLWVEAVDCYE
jgi:hypothetical protein